MTKRDYNREFISIAENYFREGLPNPIEAASEHPLMRKATDFALFGEPRNQAKQDEYLEMLVMLGWEFDLGPDELCQAMRLSQDRAVND